MRNYLFILFIFFSFITRTVRDLGTDPILSRLTLADIFGALGLIFGLPMLIKGFSRASKISRVYQMSIILVLCFFGPILFSFNIQNTLIESLIILFLILISINIFEMFKDKLLSHMLPLLCITLIVASILGFYDLLAGAFGMPRIFPQRTDGEALSGFRNAGQAGAYYLTLLTAVIPFRYSKIYELVSPKNRKLLRISIIFSLIFIFLTGKIAAYIGLLAGLFLLILLRRNYKALIAFIAVGLCIGLLWNNLGDILPRTQKRITDKYNSRIVSNLESDSNVTEDSFFARNYGNAVKAFEDRPFIGSGLGGFAKVYDKNEVHSTYFKMLGETGLIGLIGYTLLVLSIFSLFRYKKYRKINPYADYLWTMFPLLIGCFISWGYTYHLRKREFWILVAIIIIAVYQVRKYNEKALASPDERALGEI